MGGLAATGAAFAAGDLCLAQAAAITAAVGDLPDDVPAEVREQAERELVGYAETFDAQQLSRLGQHITPDGHGTVLVRGRLTDEAAAIGRAALDPLARPLPATAAGPDPRAAGQRRADALEELARRALAGDAGAREAGEAGARETGPGTGRAATTVSVTIPWRTLADGVQAIPEPGGCADAAPAAHRRAPRESEGRRGCPPAAPRSTSIAPAAGSRRRPSPNNQARRPPC